MLGFIVEKSGEVAGPYIVSSTSTWKRGDQVHLENIKKWKFPKRIIVAVTRQHSNGNGTSEQVHNKPSTRPRAKPRAPG